MTLLSARRTPNELVLCGDSQETITRIGPDGVLAEYRKAVQKIVPSKMGNYSVTIAGSGHATLIESFIVKLGRRMSASASTTLAEFVSEAESELIEFYANDVALCPDATEDKYMKLFIAAVSTTHEFDVWVQELVTLRPLKDNHELVGWDEDMYVEADKRLHSDGMSRPQAVLAGIYVITIGKESSNYIGGQIQVVVMDAEGFHEVNYQYVREMESRLKEYEGKINKIFLGCSDTTVSVPDLEDRINEFKQAATDLHREHMDQVASKTSLEELLSDRPLKTLPGFITVGTQGYWVEHDREKIQAMKDMMKKTKIMGGAGPIRVTVHCDCGTTFEVNLPNFMSVNRSEAPCTKCGKEHALKAIDVKDIELAS